jgi:hypothetical protein
LYSSKNILLRIVDTQSRYLKINESYRNTPWKNNGNRQNLYNTNAHKTRREGSKSPFLE